MFYQELANEKGITSEQARLQVQNGQISGQEASGSSLKRYVWCNCK